MSSDNFLVISAIGENRWGLVDEFSKNIRDSGCNILDSRMAVLGNEFAFISLVSGSWSAIAKIEGVLDRLEDALDLRIIRKRTESREPSSDKMPYAVEVISIDQPGIVNDIAHFYTVREIDIEDLYSGTYSAIHTGSPMFSLHMTISVPTDNSIATLRGEFYEFCDRLNIDAIMEPVK